MSSATQITEEETDLKFLTNAEMRDEICAMANTEVEKKFQKNSRSQSRRFTNKERVGIIMHLLSEYDLGPLSDFTEQAVQEKLQRSNGKTLNKVLDDLAMLELEKHGNHQNGAKRLNRDQLKSLYRYLEEYNNEM